MPFKSKAQRAKFFATPALRKYIPEFDKGTKKKLPHRIGKKKMDCPTCHGSGKINKGSY